ncbi:MAG: DUF4149 domain-containing protein [Campylobacteraceae bacterium]|nr:DUF4149 domain-containing protein [Campylobacteraceae bacterium]
MQKVLNIYLFMLALLIGLEFSAGAFVAPVIFNPSEIIGDGILTHFQSGQLMTEVFLRFNNFLIIISIISFVYESVNFAKNRLESFNRKFSTFMLSLLNLFLALVFVFYFTDYIVEAQHLGTTQTQAFSDIHNASEWTMKVILFSQTFLFFLRFPKINKAEASKK